MNFNTNKEKGNSGLALAIGYFGSNGYTVSVPLNDTQDYDLVIDNGNGLKSVQVKATSRRSEYGISIVSLSSQGGTNGSVYKTLKDTNIDFLFILTELQEMYLIPKDYITATRAMNLGSEKQIFRVDNINTNYLKEFNIKEFCINCGTELSEERKTHLCSMCYEKSGISRKVERPDKEILLKELLESNFSAVGKKYGVSDNAIRKWCISYGIPSSAKEIKKLKNGSVG